MPSHMLKCLGCYTSLCSKASKSFLISDVKTSVYSTEKAYNYSLREKIYHSSVCNCQIKELLCKNCTSLVGYNVVSPCYFCLKAKHNGHLLMFNTNNVIAYEEQDTEHFNEMMDDEESALMFR